MSIFRLNADGSIDSTFALRSGIKNFGNTRVDLIAFQQDGKVLIGGAFDVVNGYPRLGLARLLSDTDPLAPTSVVSRKTHGNAGTFEVPLPLTGPPGIECRTGGTSGNHQVIVTFPNPVIVDRALVTSGVGRVSNMTVNGNDVTVDLTGVTNAQTITLTLKQVTAGMSSADVSVSMGVLFGDTNADGFVDSADITQTKSQSGNPLTSSNFREDVNIDGFIDSADISLVKAQSGTAAPPATSPASTVTPTSSSNKWYTSRRKTTSVLRPR